MSEAPRRKPPTKTEIIAALLIENQALKGDPISDWETLKAMTAEQIVSLVEWQHVTYNVWIEDRARQNHPTVLTPMYIKAHREVTAKKDIPTIAKSKRIAARHINHQRELDRRHGTRKAAMAEKIEVGDAFSYKGQAYRVTHVVRPQKPKQKIKSRGFQGSRRFDGTVKWKNNSKGK